MVDFDFDSRYPPFFRSARGHVLCEILPDANDANWSFVLRHPVNIDEYFGLSTDEARTFAWWLARMSVEVDIVNRKGAR